MNPLKETLSGTLKGSAANRDTKTLSRFIRLEKKRKSIPGRLELKKVLSQEDGIKVILLAVDIKALERMRDLEFKLCLGASGEVCFNVVNHNLRQN